MTTDVNKALVQTICKQFFDNLELAGVQDHPEIFDILDEYLRSKGHKITINTCISIEKTE